MNAIKLMILAMTACIAMSGCLPEKRVVWSPNGRQAAVIGGDGLYFCDETGKLSARVIEHAKRVAWLPDSTAVLVIAVRPEKSWAAVAKVLGDERAKFVIQTAEEVRFSILHHEGDIVGFEPPALKVLSDGEKMAAGLYLVHEKPDGLPEKLGDEFASFRDGATAAIWSVQLCRVNGDAYTPDTPIFEILDELNSPTVSPDGRCFTVLRAPPISDGENLLLVGALDGRRAPQVVANNVSLHASWSPDGRSIAYAYTNGHGDGAAQLGAVAWRVVRDADGDIPDKLADAQDLAGVIFQSEMNVRFLPDGRLLFATMEAVLPCSASDMPSNVSLYAANPGQTPTIARVLPREIEASLGAGLPFFDISPDGQLASIPDPSGALSICRLSTGELWVVLEGREGGKLHMLPSWRSPNEIAMSISAATGDASKRATVELLTLDWKARSAQRSVLSAEWPDEVVKDFLVMQEK